MCFAIQLNNPDEGAVRFYFVREQTNSQAQLMSPCSEYFDTITYTPLPVLALTKM